MKEYIYRMPEKIFLETAVWAEAARMSVEEYVTKYFGLLGRCAKIDVFPNNGIYEGR